MNKIITFSDLDNKQLYQYKSAVQNAFPKIITESEVVKSCWKKIERYFPEYQLYLTDERGELIGFMNTIPFYWDKPLEKLSDDGWDWQVEMGLSGYENEIKPNILGGLQVIVTEKYLGKGYSKLLIAEGKKLMYEKKYTHLVIPIRPIFKSNFPEVKMIDYLDYRKENKIYDPWIRTHLNGGARIIKICTNSMNVTGNIPFWERIMGSQITHSGQSIVKGALNPVAMDIDKNYGEYREENIWLYYK